MVELHSEIGGWEGYRYRRRKAGARGLSGINGKVQWSPVAVLPTVEKVEMCLESCFLDASYTRRVFPM